MRAMGRSLSPFAIDRTRLYFEDPERQRCPGTCRLTGAAAVTNSDRTTYELIL
jgi:hypothetical protein